MTETEELQPWDKRDNETPAAFQAFKAYRDMGPARSIAKVARALDKSRNTINPWSARNEWVDRAAAWDRYCDQQDQRRDEIERQEGRRAMHEDHARVGKRMWQLTAEALGVAANLPDSEARDIVKALPAAVQVKVLTVGLATEVRARHQMIGRGLDPRDAERIADELIEIALRFVPEDNQAAFLSEIESFMLGA